jgi:hypothetical protein
VSVFLAETIFMDSLVPLFRLSSRFRFIAAKRGNGLDEFRRQDFEQKGDLSRENGARGRGINSDLKVIHKGTPREPVYFFVVSSLCLPWQPAAG